MLYSREGLRIFFFLSGQQENSVPDHEKETCSSLGDRKCNKIFKKKREKLMVSTRTRMATVVKGTRNSNDDGNH